MAVKSAKKCNLVSIISTLVQGEIHVATFPLVTDGLPMALKRQ